ncbi:carbohydrate kinase family protein [Tautonia plasticadhaerens]|uniref:2-dehydro-3-deoxygluconokinase n=1 Tax=Tautonia plasticadhaerens TaxID=2527974 RepID=A0A518HBJ6_9BACT|nr:carbohydrate kinase family protein [Tautonia plasticadhaerens]QDV38234.1 2-dehydro-3-deoxygluconokinase [Tautonia plasticadhaerens]
MSANAKNGAPVICAGVIVADHLTPPIDRFPGPGELVKVDDLVLNIGGLAANVAVVLSRLGVGVRISCRVGGDAFGRFVAESLEREGVDTSGLVVDPDRATSQTLIVNVKGQDRRFIHSFGANAALSAADLDAAITPGARVLYVGGYLILPGLTPDSLAGRFARAREQGITTVLDVACPGPADYLAQLEPVLPHTDVFLPNSDEAALILGGEDDAMAQAEAFRALGASRVVITRGEHGSVSLSECNRLRLGVYPVDYVDGTGSGDAFDAGYIAGLISGLDEPGCLKLASALGASCVRAVGTTAGIFSRPEADRFIAEYDLPVRRI